MKRLLIVAYYFPPLGGASSMRTLGFARHLPDFGWTPTVLAPRNASYFRDESLDYHETGVLRGTSLELSRIAKHLLRTGGDETHAPKVSGVRLFLRNHARRHLYFPDAQLGWYPGALSAACRHLRNDDFDAVLSTSFPITNHLIARTLQRYFRCAWVADFQDLWSDMLSVNSDRQRAERLEVALLRQASHAITVSPSWAELFAGKSGRQVTVIRNGHNGIRRTRAPLDESTLAYAGSFYPETQDLATLWSAIAKVNESSDCGRKRIAVRVIGDLHDELRAQWQLFGLTKVATSTGFLPNAEAVREMAQSLALIVAGPRDGSGILKGQVPSKISEYLATDRPIIYIGDPFCDAAELLKGYPGTHIIPPGDTEAAVAALRSIRPTRVERDTTGLSHAVLTGELSEVLDGARSLHQASRRH